VEGVPGLSGEEVDAESHESDDELVTDLLVEEVSIDGLCGVY
jgi:mycofactocin precursor